MSIVITPTPALDPRLGPLLAASDALANSLYPAESNHLESAADLAQAHVFVVAALDGEQVVGMGAVKAMDGYGEIKRMFVQEPYRGRGIAGAILKQLEVRLGQMGLRWARLETGIYQGAALSLYRRHGYVERGPFGAYGPDPLSIFMEKYL